MAARPVRNIVAMGLVGVRIGAAPLLVVGALGLGRGAGRSGCCACCARTEQDAATNTEAAIAVTRRLTDRSASQGIVVFHFAIHVNATATFARGCKSVNGPKALTILSQAAICESLRT